MDTTAFQVTAAATRHILAQAAAADAVGLALRIAARQEADGSIAYGMGFDDCGADDEPLTFDELTVLIAPGCEPLLQGTVLDYVEIEPGAFHLIFIPPVCDAAPDPAPASPRGCGSGGCSSCGGA